MLAMLAMWMDTDMLAVLAVRMEPIEKPAYLAFLRKLQMREIWNKVNKILRKHVV